MLPNPDSPIGLDGTYPMERDETPTGDGKHSEVTDYREYRRSEAKIKDRGAN